MSAPRKPGRPPLDDNDPSVNLTIRIPSRQYDALFEQAQRDRVSLPEVIRRRIRRDAATPKDDDSAD